MFLIFIFRRPYSFKNLNFSFKHAIYYNAGKSAAHAVLCTCRWYKVCHVCYFNQSSVRHLFLISRPRPSLCSRLRTRRKWNRIVFGCRSGAAKKNQTTFLLQKKKKPTRLTIVFLHLRNFEIHIFVFYQRMNFYCIDKVERNVIVVTLTLRAAREFD